MIYFCVKFQNDPQFGVNLTFFAPWLPYQRPPFWIYSTPQKLPHRIKLSALGIVGWVDFELRNFLPKVANIAFRCRKFPVYNIIIDGILQQPNQYVRKLLLVVYFSVFVFVNIRLTINYIQVNTAHVLFTTFKAEWRK